MLGYPTQFAQVECIKLVASNRFAEKRVGYLGLTLLLDESSEVSMLSTNSLKQDLQHTNQYISSLALSALANGSPREVCRALLPEVESLLSCSNPFIRKKAAVAAAKCVRRLGDEAVSCFASTLPVLATDRSHGVLLGACALLFAVLETQPDRRVECRQQLLQPLAKALRTCSSASHPQSAEYDIAGIVDPLLQSRLLRAVALLAEGDATATAAVTDLLAHVATNTDGSKNAGNCVLYECVRAIVSLDTDQGLRVLALNILGRFLSSREQNLKYVALETLHQLLRTDSSAVTRHRDTLLECLKDCDTSIRRRALEVLIALLSPQNIRVLGRELLSFLLICDKELKPFAAARLAMATETHAPTRRWQFDATLKLLCLAGQYVEESAGNELLSVVLRTPELQSYAVHKLFFCLREGSANSPVLAKTALYCVGEFGDLLVAKDKTHLLAADKEHLLGVPSGSSDDPSAAALSLTAEEVVDTLAAISQALQEGQGKKGGNAAAIAVAAAATATSAPALSSITEALMTCLAKLTTRLPDQRSRLLNLLRNFTSSRLLEVQQRSLEFVSLLESTEWQPADIEAIFERMPLQQQQHREKPVGEVCFDLADLPSDLSPTGERGLPTSGPLTANKAQAVNGTGGAQLLELDDLLGLAASPPPSQKEAPQSLSGSSGAADSSSSNGGLDLLADLLGGASLSAPGAVQPSSQRSSGATGTVALPAVTTDPFAGLIDLANPPSASSGSAAVSPPSVNSGEPLASLLESALSPPSPQTTAAAGGATDPLALALNAESTPDSAAGGRDGVFAVQVLDEEGLRVVLKCRRLPSAACEIVAEFTASPSSKPLLQFRFEAAVPKYLQLQLDPPTDSTVLPGAPPVQQRLRVTSCPAVSVAATSPQNEPKPLLMKCRVTYLRDGETVQKGTNVASFPAGLLEPY
ncbi:gamma-adaptin, putative [Eimeria necatrix]|uniref:AP-1 complex subunit gamma n=1 Tax=Eimeria necatrix TaxID=51315 RepID=U6MZZ7_9EIME|nr:gamma-adaptin, putative [Eimeria necatrix]CDJ68618.1 gamma-adaptin, putative [Eimeria necatrix]